MRKLRDFLSLLKIKIDSFSNSHLMKLRSLIFLILTFASVFFSLRINSKNIPRDTLLSAYFEKAADLMSNGEYDSAQYYFDKAFHTRGVQESNVYPVLMNEQGTLYFYLGLLEKSRNAKLVALRYLNRVENLETHISVHNDLGILYHRANMNDSAVYFYNKALDDAQKFKDDSWLANLHMNVSVFYFNLKKYKNAETHIDEALKYVVRTDDESVLLFTWQVRAAIKAQLEKFTESKESIDKAWAIACKGEGNKEWMMRCIPSFYKYFSQTNQADSVDYYFQLGDQLIADLPENSASVVGFIQSRSENNFLRKKYHQALKDYHRLNKAETGTNKFALYERMANCYHHLGNESMAYNMMDSARMWTDSLAQEKITSQIADFQIKYETINKKLEITNLKHENLKKHNFILKISFILLFLVGIIIVIIAKFLYRQLKYKKEIKRLQQEKELISARRYLDGLETECKYFAKELHDGIANDLLGLQMLIKTHTDKPNLNELSALINGIRNNVRTISHELMSPDFKQYEIREILAHYVNLLTESTGIQGTFHYSQDKDNSVEIPYKTAHEIYRIVQETSMNIFKHTNANKLDISLMISAGHTCTLSITDNGKAIATDNTLATFQGIGLRTLEDRITAINGIVKKHSDNNKNIFTLTFAI